jgi:NAD(P)H-dependent flavin oxidoreductase YrpB (nitropropane dioxygenase family)
MIKTRLCEVRALGDPAGLVERAHDVGAKVIHQVHTVSHAREVAEPGVDVIIAQGSVVKQRTTHEVVPFTGQTTGLIRDVLPAGEIVRRMVSEAEEALQRVS